MNAAARLAAIATFIALSASVAAAQSGGPIQCLATSTDGGHVTMYLSQMIPSGGASASPALNQAWSAFVMAAYKVQSLATAVCRVMPADPAMQQRVQDAYQRAAQGGKMQLVNVNWTPGQKQSNAPNSNTNPYAAVEPPKEAAANDAAPAADAQNAPPPADQGPQPRASYCYSDDKKPTIYFSDAFDTADLPSPKAWSVAFGKMLAQKYMYKGIVTCKDSDTIFNAQGAIRDQKDALTGKQFVDTDWTYEPPAPATTDAAH